MNRRQFINESAIALGVVSIVGCGEERSVPPIPQVPHKRAVETLAVIAVKIGERIAPLPHPVLKITGLILQVSGMLVVFYIEIADAANAEAREVAGQFKIPLDEIEVMGLRDGTLPVFARFQDGSDELLASPMVENA
jgi:hypothetical protein